LTVAQVVQEFGNFNNSGDWKFGTQEFRQFRNSSLTRVMRQHDGIPTGFQIFRGEKLLKKKSFFYVF
jgi:hypothetical protein